MMMLQWSRTIGVMLLLVFYSYTGNKTVKQYLKRPDPVIDIKANLMEKGGMIQLYIRSMSALIPHLARGVTNTVLVKFF